MATTTEEIKFLERKDTRVDGRIVLYQFIFSFDRVKEWEDRIKREIPCSFFTCHDYQNGLDLFHNRPKAKYVKEGGMIGHTLKKPKILYTSNVKECCSVSIHDSESRIGILTHFIPSTKDKLSQSLKDIIQLTERLNNSKIINRQSAIVHVITGVITEHLFHTCDALSELGFTISGVHYQPIVGIIETSSITQYYCTERLETKPHGKDICMYWKDSSKKFRTSRKVALNTLNGALCTSSSMSLSLSNPTKPF